MNHYFKRKPKKEGIYSSACGLDKLLPGLLNKIEKSYLKKPVRILEEWPKVIGEKLAPLTEAVTLENGVLLVRVKSSTLYSLLAQNEKARLLKVLQKKFSKDAIRDIVFRIG